MARVLDFQPLDELNTTPLGSFLDWDSKKKKPGRKNKNKNGKDQQNKKPGDQKPRGAGQNKKKVK